MLKALPPDFRKTGLHNSQSKALAQHKFCCTIHVPSCLNLVEILPHSSKRATIFLFLHNINIVMKSLFLGPEFVEML